jgi:hypothetical protein
MGLRIERKEVGMKLKGGIIVLVSGTLTLVIVGVIAFTHIYKKEKGPIKIGLVTTLTGSASTAGVLTDNVAQPAIAQANAACLSRR